VVEKAKVDMQSPIELVVDVHWNQSTAHLPENFGLFLVSLHHDQNCSTPGLGKIFLPWPRTNHLQHVQAAQAHECAKIAEGLVIGGGLQG
jgi:hypothetical protein